MNMEAKVNWHGRLTFTGSAETGFSLPLGSEPEVGGDNDGFRPTELIAIGLAGCTAMDVISILGKKRQEVTDFEVQTHTQRAEEQPHVFTHAVIEYLVTGRHVEEDAVVRSIELSATRYCPAIAMLSKATPIDYKYQIFEDQGNGQRAAVKSGTYVPQGVTSD
jgi:putative redox protein